jgi:hypothetical protein
MLATWIHAASIQGRRLLAEKRKGKKNNQAAQAIDQSKWPFGGGINQAQTGEKRRPGRLEMDLQHVL